MTKLDIADLEQIVSTLQREHEHLTGGRKRSRVGATKRLLFAALRVVAYSVPITLSLLLLGVVVEQLGGPKVGGTYFVVVLGGWLVVALVLLLPLTLLNLPLIVTAWKQRRPIVSRNLLVPAYPSWQLRARWIIAGLTVLAAILAVALPEDFGWFGFVVFLVVVVFPFLLIMLQSFLGLAKSSLALTRSIEELEVVLREQLESARREGRSEIELPHEIAVRLSDTTNGILHSERLRSIDESMIEMPSRYSVSQSSTFRDSLASFAPEARLAVLDRIQELAQNQRPEGVLHDEAGGQWRWPLSEAGVELVYEVANETRQVLVREVRASQGTGGGTDDAG